VSPSSRATTQAFVPPGAGRAETPLQLHPRETGAGVRALFAAVLRQLTTLPLSARLANAISQTVTAQRAVIETSDLEARLGALETSVERRPKLAGLVMRPVPSGPRGAMLQWRRWLQVVIFQKPRAAMPIVTIESSINFEKFANTVLYLLHRCAPTRPGLTALVKLVWYVDSWHYQRHLRLVTDAQYVALPNGPVLDDYKDLFNALVRRKIIARKSVPMLGQSHAKDEFSPVMGANKDLFLPTEIAVLEDVVCQLGNLSGWELIRRTHSEAPWLSVWRGDAAAGRLIPRAAMRWGDNLPSDDDLVKAKRRLSRPDVKRELAALS